MYISAIVLNEDHKIISLFIHQIIKFISEHKHITSRNLIHRWCFCSVSEVMNRSLLWNLILEHQHHSQVLSSRQLNSPNVTRKTSPNKVWFVINLSTPLAVDICFKSQTKFRFHSRTGAAINFILWHRQTSSMISMISFIYCSWVWVLNILWIGFGCCGLFFLTAKKSSVAKKTHFHELCCATFVWSAKYFNHAKTQTSRLKQKWNIIGSFNGTGNENNWTRCVNTRECSSLLLMSEIWNQVTFLRFLKAQRQEETENYDWWNHESSWEFDNAKKMKSSIELW